MKLSLNWIKDYVQIPADMDLKNLAYDLTMSTVEVEGVTELARRFDGIVAGDIREVLPHPNADKLRICRVDIGDGAVHDIVCGGSNLEPGMSVVVACPGSFVRWHGEGEPVEIKNAKLRGVASFGMICAAAEVGLEDLFPAHEEAEIMDITAFHAPAGTPLARVLDLDDVILEIDNKSMTNRPDLWGHYGIAREISALYDLPLKPFTPYLPTCGQEYPVVIADPDRCPRYIGTRIDGVSVKPAPFAMQTRIWRVGMRPINALVDISNYVMLATGQPTHLFDADRITGPITVRRAGEGEKLSLLNGKQLTLNPDDLVIADAEGAVALAGVMGGDKDSVLPDTHRVILEVASFESTGVRRTALRYDNRTEASSRYEKAIDPDRCDLALSLTMQLLAEQFPEMNVTSFTDRYIRKLERNRLDVALSWLERRLGKRIPNDEIAAKLGLLGFEVSFTDDVMHLVVPTWRSTGDVSIKADIMEEVARMYGYENFEPTPIMTTFTGAINQLDKDLLRRIKEYLAFRCNMQEIFTYPWMDTAVMNAVLGSDAGALALSTPPAPENKYIRSSLLPNLIQAVAKNERFYSHFNLFEEAQIFRDDAFGSMYDPNEKLPVQRRHIAGAFAGASGDMTGLFRTAKGVLAAMPRYTHMEAYSFRRVEKPVWADEVVWLNLYMGETRIGDLALLSKKVSMTCGVRNLAVVLFELDSDALVPFRSRTNTFTHLAEYPVTDYDLSMLFDADTKWERIAEVFAKAQHGDRVLRNISFVDEYKGGQVPAGKKSVTLRLSIGSDQKTLTSQEIESAAAAVVKRLTKTLGAEMRTK